MAIPLIVRVAGKVLKGVSGYTVEEESTPVDVSDTSGATGRIGVPFFSTASILAKRMKRKTIDLTDRGRGKTRGIVRTPSGTRNIITLTADMQPILLSVERVAEPFVGTLGDYFEYLLGLVGITSGFVITDPGLEFQMVVFPGWKGNVWVEMKKLMPVVGAEVTYASNNIVLRPLRERRTVDIHDSDYSWSDDESNLALSVEGYVYNSRYNISQLAYPAGGWDESVPIYQVGANETLDPITIPLDASMMSVDQPVAQNSVLKGDVSASVYSVVGNDNLPIPAAQWIAAGGYINVEISEDTRSLIVTIHGADISQYAPFRIAASAGSGEYYSTLRIVGEGVFFDKKLYSFPTGVDPDIASTEVGVTVDNHYITTLTQLFDLMLWPLARYGGGKQSIGVVSSGVNNRSDNGVYTYPTIADFNTQVGVEGWVDIADFNTAVLGGHYGGNTIADFNAYQYALVEDEFVNQAFGNVAGARTFRDGVWWRIRKVTQGIQQIQYSAETDTIVADFNTAWDGAYTIADFNDLHDGMTIGDFNVAPLDRIP